MKYDEDGNFFFVERIKEMFKYQDKQVGVSYHAILINIRRIKQFQMYTLAYFFGNVFFKGLVVC